MPQASARPDQMARQGASVTTKPLWCTIAELSHAKAPIEAIAEAVKLSPRAFLAWQARLANAVASEAAKPVAVAPEKQPKPHRSASWAAELLFREAGTSLA
jgi:hypothetical protein